MSLPLQILAGLTACVLLYGLGKIIQCAVRLWPDSKGLTIDEEVIIRGKEAFEKPLEIPLASMELFHSVVPGVFFFKENLDLDMLKEGLSQCVDAAPILRGRIKLDSQKQQAVILAGNEGISMRVQTLKGHDISHFKRNNEYLRSRSTYQIPIFLARLKLEKILKGEEALLRIVVTRFENGGTAIGFVFSHLIFDALSAYNFFNLWSLKCRELGLAAGEKRASTTLFESATNRTGFYHACGMTGPLAEQEALEKALHKPLSDGSLGMLTQKEMTASLMKFLKRFFGSDDRHLTIEYSEEDLALLKEAASVTCGEGEWVGSNDAISAHVWHMVTKLQQISSGKKFKKHDPHRSFYIAVDCRSKLEPKLETSLIGNAIVAAAIHENVDTLLETGKADHFSRLALQIRSSLQSLTPEYTQNLMQWIQRTGPKPIEKVPLAPRGYFKYTPGYAPQLMLTNGRRADFYGLDFGNGKPQWLHLQGFYGACLVVSCPENPKACDIHLSFPPSISIEMAYEMKDELLRGYRKALKAAEA